MDGSVRVPKLAEHAEVLGGLARVVSFARDPSAFYLRIYLPGQKGYRHTRIQGANSLDQALVLAPSAYRGFIQPAAPLEPKRGTRPGTKLRPRKNTIRQLAEQFLQLQEQRVVSGEIKEVTAKGKRETIRRHLLGFCELQGVVSPAEITVDTFKTFPAYRAAATTQTKRKEIGIVREFLAFLDERDLLHPKVAAKLGSLLPMIRKTGEDKTANPPITERDWALIQASLELRCNAVRDHPNRRNYYSRRMMQALVKFLYATGVRPAEARNLRWRDVEFVREAPSFYQTEHFQEDTGFGHGEICPVRTRISEKEFLEKQDAVGNGVDFDLAEIKHEITVVRVLKSKNKVVREVPCDCAELLREWRVLQAEFSGADQEPDCLVFSVPDSAGGEFRPFNHNSLNISWRETIESLSSRLQGAELSTAHYNPYSLRHSRAVFLIDRGVGVYEAAKMLGHTVQTFEQHYAPYLSRKRGAEVVVSLGLV
jgi:integrase